MPQGELLALLKKNELDAFESRVLELLEAGTLRFDDLTACCRHLEAAGQADRIPTLVLMVLENSDLERDPPGALALAALALNAAPEHEALRRIVIGCYRRVFGQAPGFDAILASSGLTTGAPARAALRVLDFCLGLQVGDTLISRMDSRAVEVVEVDRERGLFTLRRGDRTTTVPAREVVREYERIDANDFRVLRQLHPERLTDLIHNDPVALVIGLIHAFGGHIDADRLKHELVPKYVEAREWSKWWSRARTLLKRSPHVVIEGRAPVVLTYSAAGVTLEEETWQTVMAESDPDNWLHGIEGYLREQKARKAEPDAELMQRVQDHILAYIDQVRTRRPAEALACALLLERLGGQGLPADPRPRGIAADILRSAEDTTGLFSGMGEPVLWEAALALLPQARPADWTTIAAGMIRATPAGKLDALVQALRAAGQLAAMQQAIDDALADPIDYAELLYWLWKGPEDATGLKLPADADLFAVMIDTVTALGKTLTPAHDVARQFKARIKAAVGLRDYARAQAVLQQTSPAAAVTFRRRFERLEGLGDNARIKLAELLQQAHPDLWVKREEKLPPWLDPDVTWATPAGIARKTAERDELVNVKMAENARRIGEAASHGDLSENSEYKFALEERDFLRGRLAQMNRDLSMAHPLEPHAVPLDSVGVGSRVQLRDTADGAPRTLTILGPFETDVDQGVYNYRAPVCQRLMGLRIGDRARLTIDGVEREFEVVTIENGLAPAQAV